MLNQDLFDSLEAQKIVDTLMKGQKDYVDERLEKKRDNDSVEWLCMDAT